jgi:hypothetical protein
MRLRRKSDRELLFYAIVLGLAWVGLLLIATWSAL